MSHIYPDVLNWPAGVGLRLGADPLNKETIDRIVFTTRLPEFQAQHPAFGNVFAYWFLPGEGMRKVTFYANGSGNITIDPVYSSYSSDGDPLGAPLFWQVAQADLRFNPDFIAAVIDPKSDPIALDEEGNFTTQQKLLFDVSVFSLF
jgi:hypothetical protein